MTLIFNSLPIMADLPNNVKTESHRKLGQKYMLQQDFVNAKKEFLLAAKHDPQNAEIWSWVGTAARENKEYDEAIKYLEKAIMLSPNNIKTYGHIGAIYKKLKKYDKAILYFEKVLTLDKNEIWAMTPLASIYWELKNIEKCKYYMDNFDVVTSSKNMDNISDAEKRKIKLIKKRFALYRAIISRLEKNDVSSERMLEK